MRTGTAAFLFCVLIAVHLLTLEEAEQARKTLPTGDGGTYVIPGPIAKILALEFDGLASDWYFLRALVFEGGTYERKEKPRVKSWEWKWFYDMLDSATALDPYFQDPYLLGNSHLTWEAHMIRETNSLLEKGNQHRDWDWLLPFYIGFNNFYFLHDNERAAEYLAEASKRPGPSEQLASLASRLAYKEKKTENAIIFLEVIAKKTEDEKLKKEFETRLKALKIRLLLERAVVSYKQKYHALPPKLRSLVTKGIITEIPADPYGGYFSLDTLGEIMSTSDDKLLPQQKRQ